MANVFIRTVILYILIVALMRLTGKRQIGQLELTELVTAFMISELASYPISNNAVPLVYGILPAVTLVCLEVFLSYFAVKSRTFRKLVAGNALMLVRKGMIDKAVLKKARITVEELISAMRMAGISALGDVEYAFLEQNGTISVLPKAAKSPPTAADLAVQVDETGIEHAVIIDGLIDEKELACLGVTHTWLTKVLAQKGIKSEKDVFYMGIDDKKNVFLVKQKPEGGQS